MFISLTREGFGPTNGTLTISDPMGVTEFVGPSRTGKTTSTIRLLSLLLFGCEPDGGSLDARTIQAGVELATISATTSKGTVFIRTWQLVYTKNEAAENIPKLENGVRVFRETRLLQLAGQPAAIKVATEADWQAQLPRQLQIPVNERSTSPVRMAFVPFAWEALLTSDGARPLRDLIATVSGVTGDPCAEIAKLMGEHVLLDSDPLIEDDTPGPVKGQKIPGADTLRATAKKAAAVAEGARNQAQVAVDMLPSGSVGPSGEDVVAAQGIRDRGNEHRVYVDTIQKWEARKAEVDKRTGEITAWEAARAEIEGRKPTFDAKDLADKDAQVARVEGIVAPARRVAAASTTAVAVARQRLADAQAAAAHEAERVRIAANPAPVVAPVVTIVPDAAPAETMAASLRFTRAPAAPLSTICPTCSGTGSVPARSAS